MRYLVCLCCMLVLQGCTTTPEPAVKIVTQEVPVPQPCLTQEQLEEERFKEPPRVGNQLGRTPETAMDDRDILAQSALLLRAWGKDLRAAHEGCAE